MRWNCFVALCRCFLSGNTGWFVIHLVWCHRQVSQSVSHSVKWTNNRSGGRKIHFVRYIQLQSNRQWQWHGQNKRKRNDDFFLLRPRFFPYIFYYLLLYCLQNVILSVWLFCCFWCVVVCWLNGRLERPLPLPLCGQCNTRTIYTPHECHRQNDMYFSSSIGLVMNRLIRNDYKNYVAIFTIHQHFESLFRVAVWLVALQSTYCVLVRLRHFFFLATHEWKRNILHGSECVHRTAPTKSHWN